jgi:hypothetical protein
MKKDTREGFLTRGDAFVKNAILPLISQKNRNLIGGPSVEKSTLCLYLVSNVFTETIPAAK